MSDFELDDLSSEYDQENQSIIDDVKEFFIFDPQGAREFAKENKVVVDLPVNEKAIETILNHPQGILTLPILEYIQSFADQNQSLKYIKEFINKDVKSVIQTFLSIESSDSEIRQIAINTIYKHKEEFLGIVKKGTKNIPFLTEVLNEKPGIFRYILMEDANLAVELLGKCNMDKLDPHVISQIKSQIIATGWMPKKFDKELMPLDMQLEIALIVDPSKAKELINKSKNKKELLSLVESKESGIKNACVNMLIDGNEVEMDIAFHAINSNPSILIEALKKNCNKTLENLIKYSSSDEYKNGVKLKPFPEEIDNEILSVLNNNWLGIAFVGKKENLFEISPAFLIRSLQNDIVGTLNGKKTQSIVDYSEEQRDRIFSILESKIKDPEKLKKAKMLLGKYNTGLLSQEFKVDQELGMSTLERMGELKVDTKHSQEIMETMQKSNISLIDHPNAIKPIVWGIFEEKLSAEELINKYKDSVPAVFLPFENINQMRPFLGENEKLINLYEKIYFDSRNYQYNKEDEKELLGLLGEENCQSVEEYLKKLSQQNLTRKDLNLTQMLAIALYAKKDHFNSIENVKINLFKYNKSNPKVMGGFVAFDASVTVYNGHDESISNMILTINHENAHAKQFENIKKCEVENDDQIIAYTKDELLNEMYRGYYRNNYDSVSTEYDAERKAIIQTGFMLGMDETDPRLANIRDENLKKQKMVQLTETSSQYYLDANRDMGGEATLSTLFDNSISDIVEHYGVETLKAKYPILAYEYDLDSQPPRKYGDRELMYLYTKSTEHDKACYLSIIKHRLDPVYNDKFANTYEEISRFVEQEKLEDKKIEQYLIDSITKTNVIIKKVKGDIRACKLSIDNSLRLIDEQNDKKTIKTGR